MIWRALVYTAVLASAHQIVTQSRILLGDWSDDRITPSRVVWAWLILCLCTGLQILGAVVLI